ncbi:hypothetical protein PSSHI_07980 [Photobacterium sp. R1]
MFCLLVNNICINSGREFFLTCRPERNVFFKLLVTNIVENRNHDFEVPHEGRYYLRLGVFCILFHTDQMNEDTLSKEKHAV